MSVYVYNPPASALDIVLALLLLLAILGTPVALVLLWVRAFAVGLHPRAHHYSTDYRTFRTETP